MDLLSHAQYKGLKMNIESVYKMIDKDLQAVERELNKSIQSDIALVPTMGRYILNSGGKRFRPLLLILSARLCGYKGKAHTKLACILEFIHTATLLHDDVVDNANIRRGNASANTIWGNQASILIGDLFFAQSFSLIAQTKDWPVVKVLTEATTQLAQGEILDLVQEGDFDCDEAVYLTTIAYKTASLIKAACHVGALLGNAERKKEKAMISFGNNLGIAFQLMDDTLDCVSTEEEFGKTIGKDLKEGKITLPLIYTLKKSTPEDRQFIISALKKENLTKKVLINILNLIKHYHGLEYTAQKAREYAVKAKKNLNSFPPSRNKEALLAITDYAVDRRH
jgi:octaprenyl-diphosphate synthase